MGNTPPPPHSRWPAALILTLSAAACAGYAVLTAPDTHATAPERAERVQIERRIADGRADSNDWLAYAAHLQAAGQAADAAEACFEALKRAPYNRTALYRRAIALATAGQTAELQAFLTELTVSDAKLAVDVFAHIAVRPYLARADFRRLFEEARSQAID